MWCLCVCALGSLVVVCRWWLFGDSCCLLLVGVFWLAGVCCLVVVM